MTNSKFQIIKIKKYKKVIGNYDPLKKIVSLRGFDIGHLGLNKGFTLVEMMVTMIVFATLIGIVTINLLTAKHTSSLTGTIDTLVADMHQQQLRAMVGDARGLSANDSYGIHFETSTYTLFHGTTYSASDSANSVVSLGDTLQFNNVTFSGNQIVFTKGSGEVANYASASSTFVVKDTTSTSQKTISVNRLGVVTGIN